VPDLNGKIMLHLSLLPLHQASGAGGDHYVWCAGKSTIGTAEKNFPGNIRITNLKEPTLTTALRPIGGFHPFYIFDPLHEHAGIIPAAIRKTEMAGIMVKYLKIFPGDENKSGLIEKK
jgi:hypothetical protein